MKTSRRSILGVSGGAALFASDYARAQQSAAPPQNPATKLALEDYQPKSMLVTAQHPVARASFPVIDVHGHIAGIFTKRPNDPLEHLDQIITWMDSLNIQVINNVTGGWGDQLKKNVRDLEQRYKGRFINCVTPGYEKWSEPGFSQWQADELKRAKDAGARGVKILKFLGLVLRENGKEGPLVKIDDPRFDPMWEAAGALNLPVFIHSSDPDAFFHPVDRFNERWEELGHHPDWSFYGKEYPSKPELLAARNRVIARHPKTTFVGLHVANHPENLDEVSQWLRQYPNLHVDIAARLGELGRQPRRARQFFEDFQDRILFGTDASPEGAAVPQQDLKPAMFQAYFRFLETLDEYFDYAPSPTPPEGRWCIYGIGLPPAILKKVYHNNAARLFGMAQV